jgi:hypothetical protein
MSSLPILTLVLVALLQVLDPNDSIGQGLTSIVKNPNGVHVDSLFHSGEITIASKKEVHPVVALLSLPVISGLIGVIATLGGFLINDFLTRRNHMRAEKAKIRSGILEKLLLLEEYDDDLYGQVTWVDFYNACVKKNIKDISEEARIRGLDRIDVISDKMKQIRAELYGLFNEFEKRVLKKTSSEFQDLIAKFFNGLLIEHMKFSQYDTDKLRELSGDLMIKIAEKTKTYKTSRVEAINRLNDFVTNK